MIHGSNDDSFSRIENLEQAIHGLIRRERRWKQFACLVGICVVVFTLGGAQKTTVQKTVEAEAFILRDSDGKARAKLVTRGADKNPAFVLIDARGNGSLLMHFDEAGPAIALLGKHGQTSFTVTMGADGDSPALALNCEGRNGVSFSAGKDGPTRFLLSDRGGKLRFMVHERDGTVTLSLMGDTPGAGMSMRAKLDGASEVAIRDKDGKELFRAPSR